MERILKLRKLAALSDRLDFDRRLPAERKV
jgi:hypothetical protein